MAAFCRPETTVPSLRRTSPRTWVPFRQVHSFSSKALPRSIQLNVNGHGTGVGVMVAVGGRGVKVAVGGRGVNVAVGRRVRVGALVGTLVRVEVLVGVSVGGPSETPSAPGVANAAFGLNDGNGINSVGVGLRSKGTKVACTPSSASPWVQATQPKKVTHSRTTSGFAIESTPVFEQSPLCLPVR